MDVDVRRRYFVCSVALLTPRFARCCRILVAALVLDEFDNLLLSSAHKDATVAIVEAVNEKRPKDEPTQVVMCSATARDMREGQIGNFLKTGYATVEIGGERRARGQGGGGIDNGDVTFVRTYVR